MPRFKLISFDLDDTLWHTAPVIEAAEATLHTHLQQHCPKLIDRFSPLELREHRLAYLADNPHLEDYVSLWRLESMTMSLQLAGYSKQESERLAEQAFAVFYRARQAVTPFVDAEHTLAELARDYTLVSLTNGNADVTAMPFGQHFHFSLRAEQIGARKPKPEMFERALEWAKCEPADALHIGDHPDDDISGAKALGMSTLQARLPERARPLAAQADGQFSHWREVIPLIRQLESAN